jgi:acetyl-CoA acetyltransferase
VAVCVRHGFLVREFCNVGCVSSLGGAYRHWRLCGSLKDYQPGELGAVALRAAIERANVDAAQIGHVVMGTVIPTEPRDAYASRIAAGAGSA